MQKTASISMLETYLCLQLILATGIQEKETFLYDPKVDSWQVATSGPGAGACGDWTVFYALGKTWGISELLIYVRCLDIV